jgi:hypothetical protein
MNSVCPSGLNNLTLISFKFDFIENIPIVSYVLPNVCFGKNSPRHCMDMGSMENENFILTESFINIMAKNNLYILKNYINQ